MTVFDVKRDSPHHRPFCPDHVDQDLTLDGSIVQSGNRVKLKLQAKGIAGPVFSLIFLPTRQYQQFRIRRGKEVDLESHGWPEEVGSSKLDLSVLKFVSICKPFVNR
jgi:hypothetical protein